MINAKLFVIEYTLHGVPKSFIIRQEKMDNAEAWHWAWPRHGAPQLTGRFEKQAKRHMGSADWAAWIAVKAVVEAVVLSKIRSCTVPDWKIHSRLFTVI